MIKGNEWSLIYIYKADIWRVIVLVIKDFTLLKIKREP